MNGSLLEEVMSANQCLCAVTGSNFSGRTTLLRQWIGLSADPTSPLELSDGRTVAYIGPEIYNCISGLAQSVTDEVQLHTGRGMVPEAVSMALSALLPDDSYSRNPTTLSGGEQAALAILAAIAMNPDALAIDCALEQIDGAKKSRLIGMLREVPGIQVLIADNRLDECGDLAFVPSLPQPPATPPPMRAYRQVEPGHVKALAPAAPCELAFDNLSFSYGRGRPVLQGVSARLTPGRIYWLGGSNGSGKSTLAKILCGALRPRAGTIWRAGHREDAWRSPGGVVAYHFQNPDVQLFETTVVRELTAGSTSDPAARASCIAAARCLGLQEVLEEHPLDLPFSVRKRVALAATLAMKRAWVILDEPTLGQDELSSHALSQTLRGLAAEGAGVVVISHSTRLREHLPEAVPLNLRSGVLYVHESE